MDTRRSFARAEDAVFHRTVLSRSAYIWPMLSRALVNKNPNYAGAGYYDLLDDFFFSAGGGSPHAIVADAVNRWHEFQTEGVAITGLEIGGAQNFARVCWFLGKKYDPNVFEIIA